MENLSLGKKIMLGGIILSVLSLFMTWGEATWGKTRWIETVVATKNGFEVQGYILLLIFVYPLIKIIQNNPINKIVGYISGGLGILVAMIYISSLGDQGFLGIEAKPGVGMYVYIISVIIFLVGVYKEEPKEEKKEQDETEKES